MGVQIVKCSCYGLDLLASYIYIQHEKRRICLFQPRPSFALILPLRNIFSLIIDQDPQMFFFIKKTFMALFMDGVQLP